MEEIIPGYAVAPWDENPIKICQNAGGQINQEQGPDDHQRHHREIAPAWRPPRLSDWWVPHLCYSYRPCHPDPVGYPCRIADPPAPGFVRGSLYWQRAPRPDNKPMQSMRFDRKPASHGLKTGCCWAACWPRTSSRMCRAGVKRDRPFPDGSAGIFRGRISAHHPQRGPEVVDRKPRDLDASQNIRISSGRRGIIRYRSWLQARANIAISWSRHRSRSRMWRPGWAHWFASAKCRPNDQATRLPHGLLSSLCFNSPWLSARPSTGRQPCTPLTLLKMSWL